MIINIALYVQIVSFAFMPADTDKLLIEKDRVIKSQAGRITVLEEQLNWFKKQQFGGGKGESVVPNQLELELLKKKIANEMSRLNCWM